MSDRIERERVAQLRERVLEQVFGHPQQLGAVVEAGTKRLQGRQIVGAPQFVAQCLKQVPIAIALDRPERALEAHAQVRGEAVVVQQGIVDVQQKHDAGWRAHGGAFSVRGSCQVSGSAMMRALSGGPQEPGSYSMTGLVEPKIGSTTRQAASIESSRVKSVVSP